jgi:predicted N-acetyltransferase YhbS
MAEYTFYKDYKKNETLRKSFNELATLVFGIQFEDWYQKGYWNNRYIPFSYVVKNKVIANVSVNQLDFVIDGKRKKAIQIGTVMTHPDYRNLGLSASLMNLVLEEYAQQYDFMYLFANKTVLDFYPKFGFKSVDEYQFSMNYRSRPVDFTGITKLDPTKIDDQNFIYQFATERIAVSNVFGTQNVEGLFMYHCINVFGEHLYYLEKEDAIVIFEQEGNQVDIFDIVSKNEVNIQDILSKITNNDSKKIVFHFTPDYEGIQTQKDIFKGDEVLFVKTNGISQFPSYVKHPITSQA